MIKAVLFDFNNTIMTCRQWIDLEIRDMPGQAFEHLSSVGLIPPLTAEQGEQVELINKQARTIANESWVETSHVEDLSAMIDALGFSGSLSQADIKETIDLLHEACVPAATLLPGIQEALSALREGGHRLGIISNAAHAGFLHSVLAAHDLAGYFEMVLVSADVGTRKPGLNIFEMALEQMRLPADETVYVGDDPLKDVDAAKRFGMGAIWFQFPMGREMPSDLLPPDAVITDHRQILDFLKAH